MAVVCETVTFIPDLHARDDLLRSALQYCESIGSVAVLLGDMVDGPGNEREVLKMARDVTDQTIGNVLCGNHEIWRLQAIKAALRLSEGKSNDLVVDDMIVKSWASHASLGGFALNNYGIDGGVYGDHLTQTLKLYEAMEKDGLYSYLETLQPFYEDDNHFAVHAGLTSDFLMRQKKLLSIFCTKVRQDGLVPEIPQLNSFKLAAQPEAFTATDKIVITGHIPLTLSPDERITAEGCRVRLDSPTKHTNSSNIFVYDSSAKSVLAIGG